jgi:protein-disulfide isomerase-like protein with CxxC motif
MTTSFGITWDYRCPWARNAHEHVIEALEAGADWDVTFIPFSLNQVHVAEGDPDVWEDPTKADALLAMEVGIVVREKNPDAFLKVHKALFSARHDESRDIRERDVLASILTEQGVDPEPVFQAIDDGWPLETFRKEHEASVADHQVFGVPTFIVDNSSVFVRLIPRPKGDAELAKTTIGRVVDMAGNWTDLNEFKHTSIPR